MSYDTRQVSDAMIEAAIPIVDRGHETRAEFVTAIYLAMKAADQPTDEIASLKAKLEEADRARAALREMLRRCEAFARSQITNDPARNMPAYSIIEGIRRALGQAKGDRG